jgi:hypothetical protein
MTEPARQKDRNGDLQKLSDPEFFTRWAATRTRLVRTPEGKPGHGEIKREYDAMKVEYRRRIGGGLA